jgi:hypothetical protein
MTSISYKDIVDGVIEAGGKGEEGEKDITHIIEYSNIFNQAPTWKLCRSEEEYLNAMETGAFINPFLLWTSIRPSITGSRTSKCCVCEKPFGKWKYGDRAFCNVHIIPLQLGLLIESKGNIPFGENQ